jgi:hypothetical protein
MRKLFDMLNRLNGTPSISNKFKLDAKVAHKESIDVILTKSNGKKKRY